MRGQALSSIYDTFYASNLALWENAPSHQVFINFVQEKAKKGSKILEIACGRGKTAADIKELLPDIDVYGVDFSEVSIEQGKKLFTTIYLDKQDAHSLKFSDHSFDIVYSIGSFEHFSEPEKALKELYRVLKNDGKFMVLMPTLGIDPLGLEDIGRDDEGWYEEKILQANGLRQMQWNFRRETWEKIIENAGLKLFPIEYAKKFGALKPGVFYCGSK